MHSRPERLRPTLKDDLSRHADDMVLVEAGFRRAPLRGVARDPDGVGQVDKADRQTHPPAATRSQNARALSRSVPMGQFPRARRVCWLNGEASRPGSEEGACLAGLVMARSSVSVTVAVDGVARAPAVRLPDTKAGVSAISGR